MRKRGRKKMSSTAAKVYDFSSPLSNRKKNTPRPKKSLERLTEKELRESMEFRRRNRERD